GLSGFTNQKEKLQSELDGLKEVLSYKNRELDSLKATPDLGKQILSEIRPLYPEIHACLYSRTQFYVDSTEDFAPMQLVVFETDSTLSKLDKEKINQWLKKRLPNGDVRVKY